MWRTLPKERKREKRSEHLQNEGECNRNPKEPKKSAEDYHERSSQDIKLPSLSRIFFKLVKFYYQYSFINCFHNIKFSFLFISRKLIASLKKVNHKQFGLQILILRSRSRLEVMLQVEKKEYFCKNMHHFKYFESTNRILNILTIFSSYPDVKWELDVRLWYILTPILNPS